MTRSPSMFAGVALAVLTAGPVRCQQGPPTAERPAEKPAAKAPFVFEPGVVDVRTLIQRCGTYLQRNILVDDVELMPNRKSQRPAPPPAAGAPGAAAEPAPDTPSVELQLPVVTDRDGCEELLCSLLWVRGLVVVPLDEGKGVYEVLSMHGPRAREVPMRAVPRTPEQVLARPALRQFVTVVTTLKHVNATIATNALRPFFASVNQNQSALALSLGNVGNASAMLISGPQDAVAYALRLLQAVDVPQPPEQQKTELEARFEALQRQHEALLQRVAALEAKNDKDKASR
jgi:hypothetical protein